jgi:polyether ionophore transport system permease protein
MVGIAYILAVGRDLGSGVLPTRPGPVSAPGLRSPLALAWRLERGPLLAWTAGFALAGVTLGGMAPTMPEIIRGSALGQEILNRYSGCAEAPIADVFLELIIVSLGMTAAFYPVLAMLQARAEEAAGRAELVLSTATSRTSWLASHLGLALGGTVVVLGAGGAALGVTYGLGTAMCPPTWLGCWPVRCCTCPPPGCWVMWRCCLLAWRRATPWPLPGPPCCTSS